MYFKMLWNDELTEQIAKPTNIYRKLRNLERQSKSRRKTLNNSLPLKYTSLF